MAGCPWLFSRIESMSQKLWCQARGFLSFLRYRHSCAVPVCIVSGSRGPREGVKLTRMLAARYSALGLKTSVLHLSICLVCFFVASVVYSASISQIAWSCRLELVFFSFSSFWMHAGTTSAAVVVGSAYVTAGGFFRFSSFLACFWPYVSLASWVH